MSRTEAATRRVGALVVLAAASALMLLPKAHHVVVLALHAVLLLGSAAIQLAPAHRAVAGHARRAAEAARTVVVALGESACAAAAWLRWLGFASVLVIYALYYVADDVRAEEASSLDKVQGLLLFLIFLAAVWAVFVSMITGRPAAAADAAEEDELDGGEVKAIADSMIC